MKKKENKKVKEIKKFVATGIDIYRRNITKAIIDLCRETGIDEAYDIQFTQLVMLHTTKPHRSNGRFFYFVTETTLCNRISWSEKQNIFLVGLSDGYVKASTFMSIDDLNCIYAEMLNVLKNLNSSRD